MTRPSSTDVTVIGLGNMGGQLARTFLEKGKTVTVWNRSPERSQPFGALGATVAASPAEAVAASPLTVMCVSDYGAANEVLAAPGVTAALWGRTLAQLTGGHDEAIRSQNTEVEGAGCRMLAGGIVGFPWTIGAPTTAILYSGNESAFEDYRETLALLAPAHQYVGADPARFGSIFHALFAYYHAAFAGYLEGVALSGAHGVALDTFTALIPAMTSMLEHHIVDAAGRVREGDYSGEQATIDAHIDGIRVMLRLAREHGVQMLAMSSFMEYCHTAHDNGLGGEDIAAIYKLMRPVATDGPGR